MLSKVHYRENLKDLKAFSPEVYKAFLPIYFAHVSRYSNDRSKRIGKNKVQLINELINKQDFKFYYFFIDYCYDINPGSRKALKIWLKPESKEMKIKGSLHFKFIVNTL